MEKEHIKNLYINIQENYKEFSEYEVSLVDDLRIKRNKIAYDGFFVDKDYIERKIKDIGKIIDKMKEIIKEKVITN